MKDIFIVFEGGECAGKTSQAKLLADRLRALRYPVIVTHEPGGTPEGAELRARILAGGLTPEEELDLFIEDRRMHVDRVIRPSLREGHIVICDRFTDSTLAYQGYGRGLSLEMITAKDAHARDDVSPTIVILLDMPVALLPQRAKKRGKPLTRFEKEDSDFHERIRQGFLVLANISPMTHVVIDASQPTALVADEVWRHIELLVV